MSEIAIRADLRQTSLYYRFRRKEEILAEIVIARGVGTGAFRPADPSDR
jgi:AcrR family transcriptional regulator